MDKLQVNEHLIENLVYQVAPLVEQLTTWNLRLAALRFRVLPKDQGYEEIVLARSQGAGIPIGKSHLPGLMERVIEYTLEENLLAAYEPSRTEILVIRENVDDSNIDGLKLVLAHELVHRGQHVTHPHLFERINTIMRDAWYAQQLGKLDLRKTMRDTQEAQEIMSLLESHAAFVQNRLAETVFPLARIESHFNSSILLLRVIGRMKALQYSSKLPAVQQAMQNGTLDQLYQNT